MQRRTLQALLLVAVAVAAVGAGVGLQSSIDTGYDNPAPISDGVPFGAPNGFYVTIEGDTNVGGEKFTDGDDTIVIQSDAGNVTAQAGGPADVTLYTDNMTGGWTNASDISASLNEITIDPEDKPQAVAGGDIERLRFRQASAVAADDGQVDFFYGGASGTSVVEIGGAPAGTQLAAIDANTNAVLDVARSDSNGRIRFDNLDNSDHNVVLQTTDGPPDVTNGPPDVTNADPTGGQSVEPSSVSADVSDPDFPNDELNVKIRVDGSVLTDTNITADQNVDATLPASAKTGGQHDWSVVATDAYGQQTVENYSYSVPDTLTIRNETDHSQIINNVGEVEIRFFGENQVYTRSTSDGTVNMTGLPVGQNFIVTATPPDSSNYTDRTVFITNIYQQQSIYLLDSQKYSTITGRFVLEDPTGQFGADTVLYIEKPINVSGTVEYQTIHADEFGAEGVTASLEEGQRYRLRIRSASGVTQIIGPYRGEVSETVTVRPGTPQIDIGNMSDGWGSNAELENTTLTYRYSDPQGETDSLTVSIYRQGHPDQLLVPNQTFYDLGNVSQQVELNETEKKQTWVVRFEADRNGETLVSKERVSNRPDVLPDLAREWRLLSGIMLLLLSAGAFSLLNAKVGVMVISLEGGLLWWIGWLEGATTGVLVVFSLFIAVMVNLYARR